MEWHAPLPIYDEDEVLLMYLLHIFMIIPHSLLHTLHDNFPCDPTVPFLIYPVVMMGDDS